jgi:hypothetical protein
MSPRLQIEWLLLTAALVFSVSGCTAEIHRYVRFPDIMHPGWANQQRIAAIEHDPYPLNDIGPDVVGGRPREYQQPVNEVERAQMHAPRPLPFQPVPVPSWPATPQPIVPPPVVTTPYPAVPAQTTPFPVQQRSPY